MEEAAALAADWSRTAAAALSELAATAATPAAHALAQQRAVEYALPQMEIGWTDVALVSSGTTGAIGLCHGRSCCAPTAAQHAQSHPHSLTLMSLVSLHLSVLHILPDLVCDDVQHAAAAADALEER